MDMSIFDFLTGNMDRHHYETFKCVLKYFLYLNTESTKLLGNNMRVLPKLDANFRVTRVITVYDITQEDTMAGCNAK